MSLSRFPRDSSAVEDAARRRRERNQQVAQGKTFASDIAFLVGWLLRLPWRVTLWALKHESAKRR